MAMRKFGWNNVCLLRSFMKPHDNLSIYRGISCTDIIRKSKYLTLNRILETDEICNAVTWTKIRNEIMENGVINEGNVDSTIMNVCCAALKPTFALDYLKYLVKHSDKEINIATSTKYFGLLYKKSQSESLTPEEIENIINLYNKIRAEYDILDITTARSCILGLSLTSKWKDCIELLEMIHQTDSSFSGNSSMYSAIISAAFNNDYPEIGWSFLRKMVPNFLPNEGVYDAYVNYCIKNCKNFKEIEELFGKMFEFWSDNDIYPYSNCIQRFMDILANSGEWSFISTTLSNTGVCVQCNHKLPELQLDKNEFEYFSNYFKTNIFVGTDVYCNSTPQEFKSFQKFVDATKPYDVVIDGLNAAYILQYQRNLSTPSVQLKTVVRECVEQNKKIFLLGRKHMRQWPRRDMDYIRNNTDMFLTNNLSDDDLFILYAVLNSGIDTYFISRDLMRQHIFRVLNPRFQRLFRHWQMTRQIFPAAVRKNNYRITFSYPPSYAPTAHKDNHGWHIPYAGLSAENINIEPLKRPKLWMCLRHKKKVYDK